MVSSSIATLNIRHGGTKSSAALADRLLGYDADLLVVTEFRANSTGERFIARLKDAGYATSHPDAGPNQNTVLIAARCAIDRAWAFDDGLDSRHLWCAEFGGVIVCGVYMPLNAAKLPYWETLIAHAQANRIGLLIGDFNTGTNDLDKDPQGAKFVGPEMPGRLQDSGYVDVWRSLHPGVREYSWYSRPGDNGFRLDYIFAESALAQQITRCEYDHAPRLAGDTDHSALVASLPSMSRPSVHREIPTDITTADASTNRRSEILDFIRKADCHYGNTLRDEDDRLTIAEASARRDHVKLDRIRDLRRAIHQVANGEPSRTKKEAGHEDAVLRALLHFASELSPELSHHVHARLAKVQAEFGLPATNKPLRCVVRGVQARRR